MSYEDVINIINAHYGWSMDAHEPEYKGEIKEKMQAMKQLVSELQTKAKAFDELRYIMDYHYPDKEDREGVRGYQHPKAALKNIGDVIEEYESGELDD